MLFVDLSDQAIQAENRAECYRSSADRRVHANTGIDLDADPGNAFSDTARDIHTGQSGDHSADLDAECVTHADDQSAHPHTFAV